jgi:hypothetical protein
MNSFNVYGQTSESFGGNTPVWLGTVRPLPVGAVYSGTLGAKEIIKAGTPVVYNAANRTFAKAEEAASANGYLYNDIYADAAGNVATGAIVMDHAEGLLIDRTDFADQADALQTAIPNVRLIRDAFAKA